jgi:hypothetical protein
LELLIQIFVLFIIELDIFHTLLKCRVFSKILQSIIVCYQEGILEGPIYFIFPAV